MRIMDMDMIIYDDIYNDADEATRIGVGTETELFSCGVDNNPEIKCLYRCIIRPGLCNKCCKKSGFVSGSACRVVATAAPLDK